MSEQIPALWAKSKLNLEDHGVMLITFGTLWGVHLLNTMVFGGSMNAWGILPRMPSGLAGIFFAPLLHGGICHLLANTFFGYPVARRVMQRTMTEFVAVGMVSALGSGAMVWFFGTGLTVGFSGVVCGYIGYLFTLSRLGQRIGVQAPTPTTLSILMLLITSLLPGISIAGHLGGFLSGALVATVLVARAAGMRIAY